ncbi:uncharacterized protein LOC114213013 [Eumetopias jubatus]|uniref:uncharacterized protein LOC114213013 n=1 Tax=Eumetopias jubatus TaxID=34886 RepID=UPI0010163A9F|nr:uncharacterized protein LOC114213013 [Eumetopias jubatus]
MEPNQHEDEPACHIQLCPSVTTASEEQSAHTSYLPTTQFLHPSPPHPKARPRLRTHSGSLTAAATRSPLETRAPRLQMSYNFLQRKPTESQAKTTITYSQRQPEAKIGAPRTQQPHHPPPPPRGRSGARPQAPPAPPPKRRRLRRDTWLSPPRAPATPGRPPAPPRLTAAPGPAVPPPARGPQPGGVRAFRELPNARRPASTTQARRAAAGRDPLLSAHSRAATTATTAPTPPPLVVRAGHGAASSLERRRQSPNGGSTWRRGGSGGAGRGLLSNSPSQRAPLPLGIHFPEKPVSPHSSFPQLTPQCHGAPLPDPGPGGRYLPVGLRRKNPVRGDRVAGNACSLLPVSGASGAVVKWRPKLTPLAANPIQFHSPPSALPVRARAPA